MLFSKQKCILISVWLEMPHFFQATHITPPHLKSSTYTPVVGFLWEISLDIKSHSFVYCVYLMHSVCCLPPTSPHTDTEGGANYSHCACDVLSVPWGQSKINSSYVKDVACHLTCPPLVFITGFLPFCLDAFEAPHKWCVHMLLPRHKLFKTVTLGEVSPMSSGWLRLCAEEQQVRVQTKDLIQPL